MTDLTNSDKEFLSALEEIVKNNISNEKFGVSELAKEMAMSRSNLHRKVNALTKISVSQYIRQERLKCGREMLRKTSHTVSEVAYDVGFSSTSYFVKCFHDYYGYPPGDVGKRTSEEPESRPVAPIQKKKKKVPILAATLFFVVIVAAVLFFVMKPFSVQNQKGRVIAVLPLQNVSGDEEHNAMTANVHDALTTELGKIFKPPNRVISRTSTLKYKNPEISLQDIAKDLDVNTIVEGSVSAVDNEVGINIQLIDVFPKERHLHAQVYEDNIKNILKIQSQVVKDIAREIDIKLTKAEEKRLNEAKEVDPETYQAYTRGMFYLSKGTPDDFEKGINYLTEAIKKDPGDPYAYAGLALGYATKGHGKLDAEEAFKQAESAANTAIKIDPGIDMAHTALAMLYLYQYWQWDDAKIAFENAIIANSNNAVAHAHFAWLHMLYYDKEKSLYHAKQAALINPLLVAFKTWLAALYFNFEEYEEAQIWTDKALEMQDNAPYGLYVLMKLHIKNKEFVQARELIEKLPKSGYWKAIRLDAYVKTAQEDKAMAIWDEMEERAKTRKVNSCHRGMMAASLGYLDKAFEYLNEAAEKKQYPIAYIHLYGCSDNLKNDPRYDELRLKLNLPPVDMLMAYKD